MFVHSFSLCRAYSCFSGCLALPCTHFLGYAADVASTSPPNGAGFISSSVSSTNTSMMDYEVEVVEIRVKEGELNDILPH